MVTIGRLGERFEDVREIAVLRGGGLGDLVFAMPAIDSLRAAYPEARITLLGTPLAAALLAGRASSIDAVEVLPVAHGIRDAAPGTTPDPADADAFFADIASRYPRFDLAVQVHGGGRNSNPFLLLLGARHTVGTATEDAEVLERWVRYVYYQDEKARALEVVGLAGAPVAALEPVVHVTSDERAAARTLLRADGRRVVTIHPGATDPRRRWPVERFAAVAAARIALGDVVVVVGDDTDRAAAAAIAAGVGERGGDAGSLRLLAGELPIDETAAVLAVSDVVVANDSGPRHLAVALGTSTVGVFWFGNVVNAAPLDRGRHRIEMAYVTRCPVCGRDVTQVGWTSERCEHDPSYVAEITAEQVLADVEDLLRTA